MSIYVPVYTDENNLHSVSIFVEDDDGTFKRSNSEPLRPLKDNIEAISPPQGELVAAQFDKLQRKWRTPTVTFHYGKPQSFYHFLREKIAHNKFYVFTKPNLAGRISRFELHELKLKSGTSQRILTLLKEKYLEGTRLWTRQQYALFLKHKLNKQRLYQQDARLPPQRREDAVRRKQINDIQRRAQAFMEYDSLSISQFDNFDAPQWINTGRSGTQKKKKVDVNEHFLDRFIFTID